MGMIIVITHRAGVTGSEELLQLKHSIRYKLAMNEFRGWKKNCSTTPKSYSLTARFYYP